MKRKAYVDFAKWLAIFVVLMNHMELTIPFVNSFGGMFFVPIFFVLAGYTYRKKEEKYSAFVIKKAKRLLIPYGAANLLLFLFFFLKDSVLTGNVTAKSFKSLLGILYSRYSLYPLDAKENVLFFQNLNSPTWFLTALFLTYLLFEAIVRLGKKYEKSSGKDLEQNHLMSRQSNQAKNLTEQKVLGLSMAICLFIGVLLHHFCPILLPWSLECIPLFVLYMYAGYGMQKYEVMKFMWQKPWPFVILIPAIMVGKYLCGSANISVGYFGQYTVLGVANGITSSLFVLAVCYKLERHLPKVLCRLGQNTLHIMCYHLFVFMFLETGCNLFFPNRLEQGDMMAKVLQFLIIVLTFVVIQAIDTIWDKIIGRFLGRRK